MQLPTADSGLALVSSPYYSKDKRHSLGVRHPTFIHPQPTFNNYTEEETEVFLPLAEHSLAEGHPPSPLSAAGTPAKRCLTLLIHATSTRRSVLTLRWVNYKWWTEFQ